MNDINNNVKKNGDSKKIVTLIVLIATLMVGTTGATYAYFAVSAAANNNITGTVASGGLAFQLSNSATTTSGVPSLTAPTNASYTSKPMVPQYAYNNSKNVLALALTGSNDKCVDANGNVVCRVYTFTIRNNSSAVAVVNGKISFTNPTTNLKWALMTSATAVPDITSTTDTDIKAASTSDTTFATNLSLNPSGGASSTSAASGSYKQYWIIFWINETGSSQTDSGTWTANITFTSSNGTGITSTITG